MDEEETRKMVREGYSVIVKESCCCGSTAKDTSGKLGYSKIEMTKVPEGANLGLGCGNPLAFADVKLGETVLDLGSGAGFDAFIAADKVSPSGKVIGVDMTHDMLARARDNARKGGYEHVEFRLGEIENLPVADNSVDWVISNCVINLSPDKPRVFKEAFRVLKPGGRLLVSDVVLLEDLPESVKQNETAYVGCLAGATLKDEYLAHISAAGFTDVEVIEETPFVSMNCCDPEGKKTIDDLGVTQEDGAVVARASKSIRVRARKG